MTPLIVFAAIAVLLLLILKFKIPAFLALLPVSLGTGIALGITGAHSALLVVAIAAGAASFSHVNDSGFWLVSRYLHMDTSQTLKTWTVMSIMLGVISFAMVMLMK
jgi:H+/gluconate symporter-like permease